MLKISSLFVSKMNGGKRLKHFCLLLSKRFSTSVIIPLSVSENDSKMIKYLKGRILKLYFIIIFTVTLPK